DHKHLVRKSPNKEFGRLSAKRIPSRAWHSTQLALAPSFVSIPGRSQNGAPKESPRSDEPTGDHQKLELARLTDPPKPAAARPEQRLEPPPGASSWSLRP